MWPFQQRQSKFVKYYKEIIVVILFIILFLIFKHVHIRQYFTQENLKQFIFSFGMLGPVIYAIIYALVAMFFIPRMPFAIIGGVLFGPFWGGLIVCAGIFIGSTIEFLATRYYFKDKYENRIKHKFKKIFEYQQKVEKRQIVATALLRTIPYIPFSGTTIALALTKIRLRNFIMGTMLGSMPITFAYTYFGYSLVKLLQNKYIHLIISLLIIILIITGFYYLNRYIYRKYLKKHVDKFHQNHLKVKAKN